MAANIDEAAHAAQAAQKEPHQLFDTILVLDFGSQYSHLITRRLRELNVYSEMLPCTQKIAQLSWKPKGVVLSGSPYSVYEEGAPHVDPAVFELGVPVLGICYGLQEMAWHFDETKANVLAGEQREYGHADLKLSSGCALFKDIVEPMTVWMSHGDKLSHLPTGFSTIATTTNAPFAGIARETETQRFYGVQFHAEVTHTPQGKQLYSNFVSICGARRDWSMNSFLEAEKKRILDIVGERGQVIGAVSGGVDSTVAAKLMHDAIGDRFHAVLVDNGLMREKEAQTVKETLTRDLGINLHVVDAEDRFLAALKGVIDPERKRKIIGNLFIDVFQEKAAEIDSEARAEHHNPIQWLLQGTLYPDVIESISFRGPSATIKTHHNVGGLPEKMHLKLIEPLRELFKDEVRALGTQLKIPEDHVWRHPFPGPGLAIRIVDGEVTKARLDIVRKADVIFIHEIRQAGLYRDISQAVAALLCVRAVGVMGDKRVHAEVIGLKAVQTTDFMTATAYHFDRAVEQRINTRIINEVDGVCRTLWDTTSKPPGTIEFE